MVNFLFYLMALGAVLTAVGVIVARNPVMSVTSLLGSFFCVAIIYLLAGFQFLAAVQILVYAGAIMVLFLFVVMLLNLGDVDAAEAQEPMFHHGRRRIISFAVAGAILFVTLAAVLLGSLEGAELVTPQHGYDRPIDVASAMFTRYALPFEAASVLLLATAVGVMVLAKRQRPGREAASQEEGRP